MMCEVCVNGQRRAAGGRLYDAKMPITADQSWHVLWATVEVKRMVASSKRAFSVDPEAREFGG
jgi:hypothetical protein